MHNAVPDQVVVLAMIEHRHADHARILDRAAHQFVVLDAVAVVGDRDDAGLRKRPNRRQFFTGEILGNRAGRQDAERGPLPLPGP